MLRPCLIAAASLALTGAGAARADDCAPEGWVGGARTPVTVAGNRAFVLASAWNDETYGRLAKGNDTVDVYSLPPNGAPRITHIRGAATSPSLLGDSEVVVWRGDGALVATPARGGNGRVLIPGMPFPGYVGVAAARAPDGTITLVYGIPPAGGTGNAQIGLRRIAPDGTLGPPTMLPGTANEVAAQVAVDNQGTAFATAGGVAIRWPAGGLPASFPSGHADRIVPDEAGGAWLVRSRTAAHLTATGLAPPRVVTRAHGLEAMALDRSGKPAGLVVRRRRALVLVRGGRSVVLRKRRGYEQDDASVAIGSGGRAWVVWEEASDRLDSECDEFPVDDTIREATVTPHGKPRLGVLHGAPDNQSFSPG